MKYVKARNHRRGDEKGTLGGAERKVMEDGQWQGCADGHDIPPLQPGLMGSIRGNTGPTYCRHIRSSLDTDRFGEL